MNQAGGTEGPGYWVVTGGDAVTVVAMLLLMLLEVAVSVIVVVALVLVVCLVSCCFLKALKLRLVFSASENSLSCASRSANCA